MADQFSVGDKGLKQLIKFHKQAPTVFRRMSASVLSSMAVESRKEIQKTLKKDFTIRKPSMLKTGTRFQLAKKSASINQQESKVFSVSLRGFDGWEGAEDGGNSRVTLFTDAGRGGNNKKNAKAEAKAGRHTQMSDFKLKGSGDKRANLFFQAIQRDDKRRRKPFYLPTKYKGMKRGVYKFKGGRKGVFKSKGRKYNNLINNPKIVRLSTPRGVMKPRETNWMKRSVARVTTESNLKKIWENNFNRELAKAVRPTKEYKQTIVS